MCCIIHIPSFGMISYVYYTVYERSRSSSASGSSDKNHPEEQTELFVIVILQRIIFEANKFRFDQLPPRQPPLPGNPLQHA